MFIMIRRAEAKDVDGIIKLLKQVLMVHAVPRPDIFKKYTTKYREPELLALFEDETFVIFVNVDDNDTVLGYAFCEIEEVEENHVLQAMKTLYIDDICVDEEARGKHVGTELFDYVKAYAKENGFYRITLNVWECNPTAQKFYNAMGMKPLKTMMETIL